MPPTNQRLADGSVHAAGASASGCCPPPQAASLQQALRLLLQDTLSCAGTLDVTDRTALHACLNQVDRLLAVLGDPAPRLRELATGLQSAAATTRAGLAAALYRELAALADSLGVPEPAFAED